jgi:serine/threonine protein phosphatase 1
LNDVPAAHWDFIENQCLPYWETDTHLFVHANVDADLALFEQPDYMLFWERFEASAPHISGKVMVCGHTSQKTGLPANLGHAVCIDTWACGRGWLSCLDVGNGQLWQTNQAGQQRSFRLE